MTKERMTREFCSQCGEVNRVGFHVPNAVWRAVVRPLNKQNIWCLRCFTRRADEKQIEWDKEIDFYPVSMFTHLYIEPKALLEAPND